MLDVCSWFPVKSLIITDSWDKTSDIVIRRLEDEVFRLNTDIIRDYQIEWDCNGFCISDPTGRSVRLSDIGSVYWRKPFTLSAYDEPSHPDYYFLCEARYLVREIYNAARSAGAFALVEEGAERRLGKLSQLRIAQRYFRVPNWKVTLGRPVLAPSNTVAKSLAGEPVSSETVLYTTRVDGCELSASYVWLTQEAIEKSSDLTVCFVDGKVFAFDLPAIAGVTDWRSTLGKPESQEWRLVELSPDIVQAIGNFMAECGLRYGRLDFVSDRREIYFLEVNPNGQWAWLDLTDRHGLISAMLDAMRGLGQNNQPQA